MAHAAWYQLLYFPSSFHAEHGSSSSLQGPWAALPLKFPMWGSFISEEFKGRSRLSSHLLIVGTMTWVIWTKSLGETKAGVFLQIPLCESFLHVSPDGGRPLPKQCHPSGAEAGQRNQQLWWSLPSKSNVHEPQRLQDLQEQWLMWTRGVAKLILGDVGTKLCSNPHAKKGLHFVAPQVHSFPSAASPEAIGSGRFVQLFLHNVCIVGEGMKRCDSLKNLSCE